jgi:branched-chain amino acid aminotransferase
MNRAFVYGDLVFETIKVHHGKPLLALLHYERLCHNARVLHFAISLTFDEFVQQIQQAAQPITSPYARVRFVVHRNTDGFYLPQGHTVSYQVEAFEYFPKVELPFVVCVYTHNYKPCNELATLKSGNALLYVMASIWAQSQQCNDALILNEHGHICEATASNIFIIKQNTVYTPPLTEGCIAGVMRKHVIAYLQNHQYNVIEHPLTITHVQQAEGVFLTNALKGIQWVSAFENIEYTTELIPFDIV